MQKNSPEFEALRREGFHKHLQQLQAEVTRRFWDRVEAGGLDCCWPFQGSTSDGGYGRFRHKRKLWNAHAFAYFLIHGDYDRTLDVCHSCDNPPCCNPIHLWLGTTTDNMLDMWRKGRHPVTGLKGESVAVAILTETEVREIRECNARGESQRSLARRFLVNWRTVNALVLRKTWKHI